MAHRYLVRVGNINVRVLDVSADVSCASNGIHRYPSILVNINGGGRLGGNVVYNTIGWNLRAVPVLTIRLITPLLTKYQDVRVTSLGTITLGHLHMNCRIVLEVNRLVPYIVPTGHCNVEVGRCHVQACATLHREDVRRFIAPQGLVHQDVPSSGPVHCHICTIFDGNCVTGRRVVPLHGQVIVNKVVPQNVNVGALRNNQVVRNI